jgi:hypothetical protein
MVEAAEQDLQWFNENCFVSNPGNRLEVIRNELRRAGVDNTMVEEKSNLINRSINLLTPVLNDVNIQNWNSMLYKYNKGACCSLTFQYADENACYVVDDVGNFYLSESDFVRCAMFFTGYKNFVSEDGFQLNHTTAFSESLVIKNVSNCFEKLKELQQQRSMETTDPISFTNFVKDCNNPQIVTNTLKKLKLFFHFFNELDKFETRSNNLLPLSFKTNGDMLQIYFPNFELHEIEMQRLNVDDLKTYLRDANTCNIKQDIPYNNCLRFLNIEDGRNQARYTNQLHERRSFDPRCIHFPKYRNYCFLIAIKIAQYLQQDFNINPAPWKTCAYRINLTSLKFISYWIDVYAEYENIPKENIVEHYKINEIYINEYFANLIKIAEENKGDVHYFRYTISAAYHFEEHYDGIEAAVGVALGFPEYDGHNLNTCAVCYLSKLPQNIFYGDFTRAVKPADEAFIRRQDFIFLKGCLKGIKYKYVHVNDSTDLPGSMVVTPEILHKTYISTMS